MGTPEVMGLTFTPQQWLAVTAAPGPVLVLAGPGAGKTRCLTGRIAYLLERGEVEACRICAITFTNKAAQEIVGRLRDGLGDLADHMTLGTIHALCLRILRRHARRVGLPDSFGVADEQHQRIVLAHLGVHSKRYRALLTLFGRRRLQGYKLTAQDEKLFWAYTRELRSNHLIDYDEILSLTLTLLESNPTILAEWRAGWDHLLVDEFQDLDLTQYRILKLLAWEHRRLFGVGDDEQSIFSWRGAEPRVLSRFVQDFGVARPVLLDINCRCSTAIFTAARRILPPPELPLFAKRITAIREATWPVRVFGCADENEETARVVADLKDDLLISGLRRGEYAILYRTHQIGQRFEEALLAEGIPCQLARGQALADDKVISQLLASLRIVSAPEADLHVEYLARKVLPDALLEEVRRAPGTTLLEKFRAHAEQPGAAEAARCWRFLYQVENLKGLGRFHGDLQELVDTILAQGVGQLETPLEARHTALADPESLPVARELADRLVRTAAQRGRVILTPADGLEIPVKVMIQRILPEAIVEYYDPSRTLVPADLLVVLVPGTVPMPATGVVLGEDGTHLRIIEVFKALQVVEGRRYRKGFPDYVAFDTETTGLDTKRCELVELAAARVRGGRLVETFHALVHCERPIPPGATAIHGYTDADLAGQPSLAEVWPRFRAFVGDDVLVVHNGYRFDVPLLRRLTQEWQGLDGLVFLDSLPLARSLIAKGSLRLEDLAVRFGAANTRPHRALEDSECLVHVFEGLQEERLRRSRKTCLGNVVDCVALGAAIEHRAAPCPEDTAILEAARWRDLRRPPAIVDTYVEEAERFGLRCPPLSELIDRMGGRDSWDGATAEPTFRDRHPESYDRLCRLIRLVKATTLPEAIRELLDKTVLSTSDGAGVDAERVSLLTFHATKGLEFSRVYLAGVEDQQLPGSHALAKGEEDDIREARRLLYVAMTRTKDRLTLTCCKERNGAPTGGTMFLDEMGLAAENVMV
jgi:DNA helicase-2/ATP-dependent DNA helicase PcrA